MNIANPSTGQQKLVEVEDERTLAHFWDKRMSHEIDGGILGDEWKGYVLRIAGGNDKQGFPMKQGVLVPQRVRLVLSKGHTCYRPRRNGERKRKSVRGCIVAQDIAVLALVVTKQGEADIPGLTDSNVPRRRGPKRASKIRKLFALSKDDDVRKYVIRRELPAKEGKKATTKAPKIQRLITPVVLQRKRARLAAKKQQAAKVRAEAQQYAKLLAEKKKAIKDKRANQVAARRASRRSSDASN